MMILSVFPSVLHLVSACCPVLCFVFRDVCYRARFRRVCSGASDTSSCFLTSAVTQNYLLLLNACCCSLLVPCWSRGSLVVVVPSFLVPSAPCLCRCSFLPCSVRSVSVLLFLPCFVRDRVSSVSVSVSLFLPSLFRGPTVRWLT